MAGPGSGSRPRLGAQPNPEIFRPVGLAGGIDTKTDYKLVTPPKTLQALNARYGTGGSVRKRYGISAVGALTGAITALSTNTELLVCDNANMYAVNVGTGGLTTRGIVGAASISSSNLFTLGTLSTQILRGMQLEYITTGGVTYGLLAYEFANALTITTQNAFDYGNKISLILFNANTGSTIWTTSVLGIPPTSSYPIKLINPAGTVTVNTYSGLANGASGPCITSYKGNFVFSYISASASNTLTDSGTSLSGTLFTVQSISFVPSATCPFLSATQLNTNATASLPTPAVICGQINGPGTSNPILTMPLYYDIRTNGSDIFLYVVGQNYNAWQASPFQSVKYRTPGSLAAYSNASLFSAPTFAAQTFGDVNYCSELTVAPANGMYAVIYSYYGYAYLAFPNYSGAPSLTYTTVTNTGNSGKNNFGQPFSACFTPSQTFPTGLSIFDGVSSQQWNVSYGTAGNVATASLTNGGLANANPVDGISVAPSGSGFLGSRLFMFNGFPCAYMYTGQNLRSTLSSMLLVGVTPVVGAGSSTVSFPVYARAAYLRLFTPGCPVDPYSPTSIDPYPRQAPNVSFSSPTGLPTTVYGSNTNAQESIISIRTLAVSTDTLGASRQQVRTPQGIIYLGADPKYYDGNACKSLGFSKIPEALWQGGSNNASAQVLPTSSLPNYTQSTYGTRGGLLPGATYQFFFVCVDYDAQGNVIYGSPSPVFQVTVPSAAATYVLYVPYTMIPSRGYLQVYRNSANLSQGSLFIKTRQFALSDCTYLMTYPLGYGVADDTGLGSGGATELLSGGLLYAPPSGGELPNDPPPASSMGVATKQRIFLVSQENPTWVYFSKPFYPGRAPEFNSGQLLDIDPTTGPITGIAALDTTIVVFKKGYIYSFGGDGPDATGNGSFTSTIQIASDTGCTDTPSILTTEQGVWFRSTRGLQMLSRGGQVTYAAPEVEALLQGTTVVSSSIVAAQNQLRFALASGNVLVYDYLLQAWSVYVYFRPGSASVSPPTSQTSLNSTLYTTNAAGDLCVEGAGFQDGTNNLPLTVQSAWVNVAGAQGWGRVRRVSILGDFRSAHSLTCSFSYDFASTPAYNISYTASTTAQQSPYNWRVRAPRQVCQSIQVTLTDNAPAGEGAVITGLVLELGPKSQALRVPDTQSV